jgi:hypothetical protein
MSCVVYLIIYLANGSLLLILGNKKPANAGFILAIYCLIKLVRYASTKRSWLIWVDLDTTCLDRTWER